MNNITTAEARVRSKASPSAVRKIKWQLDRCSSRVIWLNVRTIPQMSHTHSIIHHRRYYMLATDSVGNFIVDNVVVSVHVIRQLFIDTTNYIICHKTLLHVSGQLYGHPQAIRAHKTKITTVNFILGQNATSVRCVMHIDQMSKLFQNNLQARY